MLRRLKSRGLIECTDVEMRFTRWQELAFAGQRRPAAGTEAPPSTGRRVELGNLTLGNGISGAVERREHGDGRAGVPPATLAMAPHNGVRLTHGDKAHSAAQAAAFELIGHATHNPDPLHFVLGKPPFRPVIERRPLEG